MLLTVVIMSFLSSLLAFVVLALLRSSSVLAKFLLSSTLLVLEWLTTLPSFTPEVCAILPQPIPELRCVKMPVIVTTVPLVSVILPPFSAAVSCSGVGLVMPCLANVVLASDRAMLMLP